MKKNMICIICPRGCSMTAEVTDSGVQVNGNHCPRGQEYAVAECTNPVRTVTATVRISNRNNTMASVKTAAPVPKDSMMEVMRVLRSTRIQAPVAIGQIILKDICGTDIVATKTIL